MAGRRAGAIIEIRECPDFEHVRWGRRCVPPIFDIERINGIQKKHLPPEMLEYGGHRSRVLLKKARLPAVAQIVLGSKGKVTLDLAELRAALTDQGPGWDEEEE